MFICFRWCDLAVCEACCPRRMNLDWSNFAFYLLLLLEEREANTDKNVHFERETKTERGILYLQDLFASPLIDQICCSSRSRPRQALWGRYCPHFKKSSLTTIDLNTQAVWALPFFKTWEFTCRLCGYCYSLDGVSYNMETLEKGSRLRRHARRCAAVKTEGRTARDGDWPQCQPALALLPITCKYPHPLPSYNLPPGSIF